MLAHDRYSKRKQAKVRFNTRYIADMDPTTASLPHPRRADHDSATAARDVVAQYRDPTSGCRFVVATPSGHPSLWRRYLDGAVDSYRRHGVESVLEYESVVGGRETSLFFVAVDRAGVVVGGMRAQGPYQFAEEAHAVTEWAGAPGTSELISGIEARLSDGVIEMKTGWVADTANRKNELTDGLARIFVHALQVLGARFALGTVAQHAQRRWRTTGGVVSADVAPVAYPDDRYQTVVMWWDREQVADLAAESQLPHLIDEAAQLAGVGGSERWSGPRPDATWERWLAIHNCNREVRVSPTPLRCGRV